MTGPVGPPLWIVTVPPTDELTPVTRKSRAFHLAALTLIWLAMGVIRTSSVRSSAPEVTVSLKASGLFVIGGAKVFAAFAAIATRFELTEVHAEVPGDTIMPPPGPEWREIGREEHAGEGDRPAFAFVTLVRDL